MLIKSSSPYFSIIIPVYRDLERLKLCLDVFNSIREDRIDFELIVVNNDPEIVILDIDLNQYAFKIRQVHEPVPGSYAARNKGIQVSKGKVLAFTDSDCLPVSNWLSTAFDIFGQDFKNEIGVLTGPVSLFYKNPDQLSDAEVYEKYTGFTTEAYAKEGHAITANWFSYRSVIEEFGGFNSQLKSNGDSELSGKISQKYQIVYNEGLIVNHPSRYHKSELVNKYKRILGGTYERKYIGNHLVFLIHTSNFIFRRYRFSLKKFFKVPFCESWAIFKVCNAINWGAFIEYISLIRGRETKR
jgi:glycosyltransferase involved in cell wall biosynthesis